MLVAEVLAWVDLHRPALLCIGAVAPGGLSQARHLCKRLRSQCPELKIVVGRWGLHDEKDADRQQLLAAGADHVETTVLDTQRTLVRVGLTRGHPAPESPPTPAHDVVRWTAPTTATAFGRAPGAQPASVEEVVVVSNERAQSSFSGS